MEDAPRHANPQVTLSLTSLALLFGMAAPLVGVISFVIWLRADIEATRVDLLRVEAQTQRAMQEHDAMRRDVEALCFARERDDRDSGRTPADIC